MRNDVPADERLYECPACGDVHLGDERDEENGSRVCPECGESSARDLGQPYSNRGDDGGESP